VVNLSDNTLQDWARVLATEYGADMTVLPRGSVRLTPASGRWKEILGNQKSILLTEKPNDPDQWRVRLQHVEKRIAQAIISAPIAFSCSVGPRDKRVRSGEKLIEVFRLAFGLSLNLGSAWLRRYTAYYVTETERAFYVAGQDRLFDSYADLVPADLKGKVTISGLRKIREVIPEAAQDYEKSDSVQTQVKLLQKGLSSELRDLDRLYTASHGQFARLLGKPSESVKGDDAIELEYFNRLEDIVAKYQVHLCFRPLSLGIVRCHVKTKTNQRELSIPFLRNL
jgi:hypothetical protein